MNAPGYHVQPRLGRCGLAILLALVSVAYMCGAARWLHVAVDHDGHCPATCASSAEAVPASGGQEQAPGCGDEDEHACPVCVMFAAIGALANFAATPALHGIQPVGRLALPDGLPASSNLPLLPLSRGPPAR